MKRNDTTILQRIIKKLIVNPCTGCWLWAGSTSSHGYSTMYVSKGSHLVHRRLWEELRGEIPAKMELDHLCRNRACINPEHLEIVSHQQNVVRGINPAIAAAREKGKALARTHCRKGHIWDNPKTSWVIKRGRVIINRQCRFCCNENSRRYEQKVRERRKSEVILHT